MMILWRHIRLGTTRSGCISPLSEKRQCRNVATARSWQLMWKEHKGESPREGKRVLMHERGRKRRFFAQKARHVACVITKGRHQIRLTCSLSTLRKPFQISYAHIYISTRLSLSLSLSLYTYQQLGLFYLRRSSFSPLLDLFYFSTCWETFLS